MRIQSTHSSEERGLDPYFTPPEASTALLNLEAPKSIVWEPAAGNGAISRVLSQHGLKVVSSDITSYGNPEVTAGVDYLKEPLPEGVQSIITNPPYKLAQQFLEKALQEVPFVALLLRTNFLESVSRLPLFRRAPPSRVWISSRRLPMMHRQGWEGPEAPSNTCFAWFVWDSRLGSEWDSKLGWFDWEEFSSPPSITTTAAELGF